jgi:hypothetical protein
MALKSWQIAYPDMWRTSTSLDEYVESLVDTFEAWPSRYVAVRVNCCVASTAIVGFAGVSLTPVMNRSLTSELMQPDNPRIESKGRTCANCLNFTNELTSDSSARKPQTGFSI